MTKVLWDLLMLFNTFIYIRYLYAVYMPRINLVLIWRFIESSGDQCNRRWRICKLSCIYERLCVGIYINMIYIYVFIILGNNGY